PAVSALLNAAVSFGSWASCASGFEAWPSSLPFQPDRALEARPPAHRRIAMLERLRRPQDLAHILDHLPAGGAGRQVPFDVGALDRVERSVGVRVEKVVVRMHRVHGPARSRTLLSQEPSELHARLEDLRLRGAFGDPEELRHFLVIESLHVVQHEGFAAAFRQPLDGSLEIDACDRCLATRGWLERRLRVERLGELVHLGLPAADEVEAMIEREPVEPRADGRVALEAAKLAMRLQEDLLQQ